MSDTEKLNALVDYIRDAEKFHLDNAKAGILESGYKSMAIQDIIEFIEHTLLYKYEDELPDDECIINYVISNSWEEMDNDDKEEAISNYLSNTYGLCPKGFAYEESLGYVCITNIEWDKEELNNAS